MTPLLSAEGPELAYGQVIACRDITITVDDGEIVTLIGSNGAGKTATLRAIAGALTPRVGIVRLDGRDITYLPAYERTKLGIALVPEGRRTTGETDRVFGNISLNGKLKTTRKINCRPLGDQ